MHITIVELKRILSYSRYIFVTFINHVFTGGRTLQILNAKEEDAGRYTCVATNEAGEKLKHYEVKVYGEFL